MSASNHLSVRTPEPEPEPVHQHEGRQSPARRGRHARRHARNQGHAPTPVVDFEALKRARMRGVPARQLAGMLGASFEACRADPCGRLPHCVYVLSLLRAESRRLERPPTGGGCVGAIELAACGGITLALRALEASSSAAGGLHADPLHLRLAAAGAATLAHMVAACGENKQALLAAGGVAALVRSLTRLADADIEGSSAVVELCVQCCRLLGNLTYGWGDAVDAVKDELLSAGGCSALVRVLARHGRGGRPLAQVLRWSGHALRNLAVGSPRLQRSCADQGAIETLAAVTAVHQGRWSALAALMHSCKAVAYLAKGIDANSERAARAGCMGQALRLLSLVRINAGNAVTDLEVEAVEAGCSVLAFLTAGSAPARVSSRSSRHPTVT